MVNSAQSLFRTGRPIRNSDRSISHAALQSNPSPLNSLSIRLPYRSSQASEPLETGKKSLRRPANSLRQRDSALNIPVGQAPVGDRWLYQLQNADITAINNTDFNLLTIDYSKDGSEAKRYTPDDLAALHQNDKEALAYLSIGEAEDYRYYFKSKWISRDPDTGLKQPDADAPAWLGRTNPSWRGNYKVRYWAKPWQNIMTGYVDKIIDAGFDGVYLDIIDGFEYWSRKNNGEEISLKRSVAARRMINFVEKIAYHARVERGQSDFYIVPQNGENILRFDGDGSYLKTISGVGIEDLFYNETRRQPNSEINYRLQWIDQVTEANKAVLAVDYVDTGAGYSGSNRDRIDDFWSQATSSGYLPYAARRNRELKTINLIDGVQPAS